MRTLRKLLAAGIVLAVAAIWLGEARGQEVKKRVFSFDATPIAYSVYGNGKPILVFVHGWSCDRSVWRKQIPYFSKKYKVVALDLAGHGASGHDRQAYTQEAFGQDIAAVVQQEAPGKVILIGHSMSGTAIMEAYSILQDRVAGLIGIDTLQDFEEKYTPQQQEEFVKPFQEDFGKAVDNFISSMFVKGTDPKLVEEVVSKMKNADPRVAVSAFEEMLKIDFIPVAQRVNIPVWCLNADLWPTKPEVNSKYVNFNLRLMPGTGHFLMLEKPDEFNRQLDDIIKQIGE